MAYPNGQRTELGYYGNVNDQRLQTIWSKNAAGDTLSKFDYTYDSKGQIQTWTQQLGTASTNTWSLGYDRIDQLLETTVRDSATSALLKQFIYGYDKAGNRTSEQIDMSVTTGTPNDLNQLATQAGTGPVRFKGRLSEAGLVTVGGVAAQMSNNGSNFTASVNTVAGTNHIPVSATDYSHNSRTNTYQIVVTNNAVAKTLNYDLNGNLTSMVTATATNTYDWDAANRMVRITQITATNALVTSEFTYDGQGRRVRAVEKQNGTLISDDRFFWVGLELAEQRDSTGANVTKRFFGQGEQIAGVNYYFTRDHLGSVREMTDGSGAVRAQYIYDPYGRRTTVLGDLAADFGFTGHYFHSASGLYLTLYRAYDSDSGRWLSRDPIGEQGGLNLYQYVGNDGINHYDPSGLASVEITGSDGNVTKLDEPSNAQVRAAIAAFQDHSIVDFSVVGHGNPQQMYFAKQNNGLMLDYIKNNRVEYDDDGSSFADSIRSKLSQDAVIHFRGCNTAGARIWTWEKNISKQTASELPGTYVWGSVIWRVGPAYPFGIYVGSQHGATIPMRYHYSSPTP